MRQGDGSDLLGPNDPRNSDIGILHVESSDSRQEILTAISTQELQGRKQIAIVLPEQGKAFRQPVDFDGLKNMRRQLKAQLVFIAPSGPGPAEFARQRRFAVYSSLDTFKTALLNESLPAGGPRPKAHPAGTKKPGLLDFGTRKARSNKGNAQALPPAPPTPRLDSTSEPLVMSSPPPTPRISEPPGPQNVPPTPYLANQQVPPTPKIEEMDTIEVDHARNGKNGMLGAGMLAGGAAAGMLAAGGLEGDDDALYAPPTATPPTPNMPGNTTPNGAVGGPAPAEPPVQTPPEGRPAPNIIAFPAVTPVTPKSGKTPPARNAMARTTAKLPATQGPQPANVVPIFAPGQNVPPAPPPAGTPGGAPSGTPNANQPPARRGNSGKIAAVGAGAALGAGALGAAAMAGAGGTAGAASTTAGAAGAGAATAGAGTGAAGAGGAGTGKYAPGLAPLPPPYSRRQRRTFWRRTILLAALLLLLSGLLVAGILGARGTFGPVPALGFAGDVTATVTITPDSKTEANNYLFEALPTVTTPNPTLRQIPARLLTQTSSEASGTGNSTGSISAQRATGTLTFLNITGASITLGSTTLTGKDGVQIRFNGPVVIPATGSSSATAPAYAVNLGSQGNIPALDITGSCCASGIGVKNLSAFSGGQDAVPNSIVQQSDIDAAAHPLEDSLTKSTQGDLQKQLKSGERVVDNTSQCKPTVKSDHSPGDQVKTFAVHVTMTCNEEVYDLAAAQQIATDQLTAKEQTDPAFGPQYSLDGQVVTSVLSDTVVSSAGQVNVEVQAKGLWVYQFTDQMKQNIKQSLVKLSKKDAQTILLHDMGVSSATISISSGETMPANASAITLVIVQLPPLPMPGSTPTVIASPTTTPTPVNGLGGS